MPGGGGQFGHMLTRNASAKREKTRGVFFHSKTRLELEAKNCKGEISKRTCTCTRMSTHNTHTTRTRTQHRLVRSTSTFADTNVVIDPKHDHHQALLV